MSTGHDGETLDLLTGAGFRVDDALAGLKPGPDSFGRNGERLRYTGQTKDEGGTLYELEILDGDRAGVCLWTLQSPDGQARASAYERQLEAKRDRLELAADRATEEAARRFQAARSATAGIEFGQPILVGHHSEKRHRAALRRSDSHMRKGSEAFDRAAELSSRAANLGTAGVSSDDPAAVGKLEDKRTALERERDAMKSANAHYRKHKTPDGWTGPEAVKAKGLSNLRVWTGVYASPFPSYCLSNIGATIRQAAKRTRDLADRQTIAASSEPTTETLNGATITADYDDNRVLIRFPARLSKEDYKRVRSAGFVWSPTRTAFVRKLSGPGVIEHARRLVVAILGGENR